VPPGCTARSGRLVHSLDANQLQLTVIARFASEQIAASYGQRRADCAGGPVGEDALALCATSILADKLPNRPMKAVWKPRIGVHDDAFARYGCNT
jgi:hypothetical protein